MGVGTHPFYRYVCNDERVNVATRGLEDGDNEDEESMPGKTDTPLSMCSIYSGNGY